MSNQYTNELAGRLRIPITHYHCEDPFYSCPKTGKCENENEDADYCNCGTDDIKALLDEAAAELERLSEVVERLPMCWRLNEDRELVQDHSVLPGMTLFRAGIDGQIISREVIAVSRKSVDVTEGTWCPDYCYASEAAFYIAAQAAREREQSRNT